MDQADFDVRKFIEQLQIRTETGELTPLIMRPAQELVWKKICAAEDAGKPVRLIVGKIRQLGISTMVAAYFFAKCFIKANQNAIIVAHIMRSSEWIYGMSRLFYETLPQEYQDMRPLRWYRPTMDSVVFASPHNSTITVGTAESVQVARGTTVQWVHGSEVAFWRKPDELMTAIKPAVHEMAGTGIILESTWNGRNYFDSQFMRAVDGENEYEAIFLGLKDFPVYSIPLEAGEELDLTADEREYQEKHEIDDALMKFVVRTKRGPTCNNEWSLFNREYPVSVAVARSESGYSVFNQERLAHMEANDIRPPEAVGVLDFVGDYPGSGVTFEARGDGPVEIWETPNPDAEYFVSMDVSEGIGADYTVAQVFRVDRSTSADITLIQAAKFRSNRIGTWEAGVYSFMLGSYFFYAHMVVESNSVGLLVLHGLHNGFSGHPQTSLGYPRLHVTLTQTRIDQPETQKLGWATTQTTRPLMIGSLARRIRDASIIIRSSRTLDELFGFYAETTQGGKTRYVQRHKDPESNRYHDDEVMSCGLATAASRDYLAQVEWMPRARSGRF